MPANKPPGVTVDAGSVSEFINGIQGANKISNRKALERSLAIYAVYSMLKARPRRAK